MIEKFIVLIIITTGNVLIKSSAEYADDALKISSIRDKNDAYRNFNSRFRREITNNTPTNVSTTTPSPHTTTPLTHTTTPSHNTTSTTEGPILTTTHSPTTTPFSESATTTSKPEDDEAKEKRHKEAEKLREEAEKQRQEAIEKFKQMHKQRMADLAERMKPKKDSPKNETKVEAHHHDIAEPKVEKHEEDKEKDKEEEEQKRKGAQLLQLKHEIEEIEGKLADQAIIDALQAANHPKIKKFKKKVKHDSEEVKHERGCGGLLGCLLG